MYMRFYQCVGVVVVDVTQSKGLPVAQSVGVLLDSRAAEEVSVSRDECAAWCVPPQ